jgi:hypothetical protein
VELQYSGHMLKGNPHEREGKALTNFERTLPPPGSDMGEEILRDPYNFDCPTVADDFKERGWNATTIQLLGSCSVKGTIERLLSSLSRTFKSRPACLPIPSREMPKALEQKVRRLKISTESLKSSARNSPQSAKRSRPSRRKRSERP